MRRLTPPAPLSHESGAFPPAMTPAEITTLLARDRQHIARTARGMSREACQQLLNAESQRTRPRKLLLRRLEQIISTQTPAMSSAGRDRRKRSDLRADAINAHRRQAKGNIGCDRAWRDAKLSQIRAQCTEMGHARIPEAEAEWAYPMLPQDAPKPQGGKGTWTRNTGPANAARRGVPLHPLPPKVEAALVAVRVLLNTWGSGKHPHAPLGTNALRFGLHIGVSDRSVRRWLDGQLRPDPTHHAAILAWAAQCKTAAQKLIADGKRVEGY